jgi:hypothetical protein
VVVNWLAGTVVGAVSNSGVIAPGNGGIGTLSVTGNVTNSAGAIWQIELSGSTSDKLAVTGNIDLQAAGCDMFQLDEPAMTRYHEKVMDYGARALDSEEKCEHARDDEDNTNDTKDRGQARSGRHPH